ncbi:hypothetical protein [Bacillus weihaiensis]|uniref:hypothetical protein n=1 Tax=Bacillus weihaiensis TaxID=1547283 RepID=UPI002357612E|nr:hypothetical protein [Bacillus weihaiensis]
MKWFITALMIVVFLCGCVEDKPRPKGMVDAAPVQIEDLSNEAVQVMTQSKERTLDVSYHVKNQNVYIECYIPSFQFAESKKGQTQGEGHLQVIVDGKRINDIYTAAFIVKGLSKGTHQIDIEVVHNNSHSYSLQESIQVVVK